MKGISHPLSTYDVNQSCSSLPLLSSLPFEWEGITVRAYQKPEAPGQATLLPVAGVSLILITQGTLEIKHREKGGSWEPFQIRAGDWSATAGEGEPQEICYHALSVEPVQMLTIHVNADFMARTASMFTKNDLNHVEIRTRKLFQDPLLTQIALALQQELRTPPVAGKLYAETAAQMLAVHLLRYHAQLTFPLSEETQRLIPSQIQRVKEYVHHHLDQDLSLAELAQQSGFSSFHFVRLFRQATGESPHQYIMKRRIEDAQRLLKETDLPVSQIALMTGFSSHSHFTRTLTKHLGHPPRQYRLKHS